MPGGRPTKLTPELQKRLCDAVAAGNYYRAACTYAGIEYQTFRDWMRQGRKARHGRHREFHDAVKKAEADAEVRMVALWQKAMPENWQAARDFLARRYPQRWATKDRVEMSTPRGQPIRAEVKHELCDLLPSAEAARAYLESQLGRDFPAAGANGAAQPPDPPPSAPEAGSAPPRLFPPGE